MPEKLTFRDSALRAVAIIGLIAILVLGAWGIIQLVVGLPDFFGNFSAGTPTRKTATEQLAVVAPQSVTSGQPFPLSWSHTNGSGSYSFSITYACAEGLTFAAPMPTGQYQQVSCNTPFNYISATTTTPLVAVLSAGATKQVTTTLTVSATRLSDNTVTATGSETLTVLPAQAQTPTPAEQKRPTSTYTPSGRTSNLYGSADLAVRILSAQPASPSLGGPAGGRYSIVFEVSNIGTNVAPYGWGFRAQLPLTPPYTYASPSQQKLYPGDKIVYTLGFDMPQNYSYPSYPSYGNTFSVTVDPQYLITDSNRANNTASVTLSY